MSEQEILEASANLTEFDAVQAGLAELRKDLSGVQFDVTTTKGDKAARAARQRCVSIRTSADAAYNDWNKPMLQKQRSMRTKLTEIKDAVKEVEDPIDAQIKAEETRKAAEKAERERIEAEHIAAIEARIVKISDYALQCVDKPSADIAKVRLVVAELEITLEVFGPRAGEALAAQQSALAKIDHLHQSALHQEAEIARLQAEREELERQKAEQEEAAAEARRIEEERMSAERAKLAAEQAEAKKAQAAAEAKAEAERKRQADAQAKIDRERAEFEAEKAAAAKAEQDKKDAEAKARQDKIDAEFEAAKQKADEEAAEAARRERVQFEQNGPGYDEIVAVLAAHYKVTNQVVCGWLTVLNSDVVDTRLTA